MKYTLTSLLFLGLLAGCSSDLGQASIISKIFANKGMETLIECNTEEDDTRSEKEIQAEVEYLLQAYPEKLISRCSAKSADAIKILANNHSNFNENMFHKETLLDYINGGAEIQRLKHKNASQKEIDSLQNEHSKIKKIILAHGAMTHADKTVRIKENTENLKNNHSNLSQKEINNILKEGVFFSALFTEDFNFDAMDKAINGDTSGYFGQKMTDQQINQQKIYKKIKASPYYKYKIADIEQDMIVNNVMFNSKKFLEGVRLTPNIAILAGKYDGTYLHNICRTKAEQNDDETNKQAAIRSNHFWDKQIYRANDLEENSKLLAIQAIKCNDIKTLEALTEQFSINFTKDAVKAALEIGGNSEHKKKYKEEIQATVDLVLKNTTEEAIAPYSRKEWLKIKQVGSKMTLDLFDLSATQVLLMDGHLDTLDYVCDTYPHTCTFTAEELLTRSIEENNMKIFHKTLQEAKKNNEEFDIAKILMTALENKNKDIYTQLSNTTFTSTIDENGRSMLMHAISGGFEEIALQLIADGADINQKDAAGETALNLAISEGMKEIVVKTLRKSKDTNNEKLTKSAILSGDAEIMQLLIDANKVNFDQKIKMEYWAGDPLSLLEYSATYQAFDVAETLINNGYQANDKEIKHFAYYPNAEAFLRKVLEKRTNKTDLIKDLIITAYKGGRKGPAHKLITPTILSQFTEDEIIELSTAIINEDHSEAFYAIAPRVDLFAKHYKDMTALKYANKKKRTAVFAIINQHYFNGIPQNETKAKQFLKDLSECKQGSSIEAEIQNAVTKFWGIDTRTYKYKVIGGENGLCSIRVDSTYKAPNQKTISEITLLEGETTSDNTLIQERIDKEGETRYPPKVCTGTPEDLVKRTISKLNSDMTISYEVECKYLK